MAITLIIEDGSIVADANTYIDLDYLRAFAAERGITTLPADDEECKVLVIKGMDYLQQFSEQYKGSPIDVLAQNVAFPREGIELSGQYLPSNEIPRDMKRAQAQASIEANSGDLLPTIPAGGQQGAVVREKVDVIEIEYAEPVGASSTARYAKVDAYLSKFLRGGRGNISLVRA